MEMRIGIDLDDTICRTTEIVHNRVEKYAEKMKLNALDIMNDEVLKDEFFSEYLEDIYINVEIKRSVKEVIKRLKSRGNEIYIITARTHTDKIEKITRKWLKEHEISIDYLIMDSYGDKRVQACKQHHIDLMIDNDPFNYKKLSSANIRCLLFDDRARYDLENNYMTTWLEIEKYIERNH